MQSQRPPHSLELLNPQGSLSARDRAKKCVEDNDVQEALNIYEEQKNLSPDDYFALGKWLIAKKFYRTGLDVTQKGLARISETDNEGEYSINLGVAHYELFVRNDIDSNVIYHDAPFYFFFLKAGLSALKSEAQETLTKYLHKESKGNILGFIKSHSDDLERIALLEQCLNDQTTLGKYIAYRSILGTSAAKAQKMLSKFKKELKSTENLKSAQDRLTFALMQMKNKCFTSALQCLNDIVFLDDKKNVEVLCAKGDIFSSQGKLDLARKQFEAALRIGSSIVNSEIHLKLAKLVFAEKYFSQQALDNAHKLFITHCNNSLQCNANNLETALLLQDVLSKKNTSVENMINGFKELITLNPNSAVLPLVLGVFLNNLKSVDSKPVSGNLFILQAIQRMPENADANILNHAMNGLKVMTKDSVFLTIKKFPADEKIPLLEMCLDQKTILGKFFWRQDGLLPCSYEKGCLKEIIDHIKEFKPEYVPPSACSVNDAAASSRDTVFGKRNKISDQESRLQMKSELHLNVLGNI